MVAMGVFSTVITVASSILLHSLKTARFVANQASATDNIALAMEQMVREVRTGYVRKEDFSEGLSSGFSFINYEGQRTTYGFCGTQICRNDSPITSESVIIKGGFYITDFNRKKTPRITVAAKAADTRGNPLGSVQTTVSARLIFYQEK